MSSFFGFEPLQKKALAPFKNKGHQGVPGIYAKLGGGFKDVLFSPVFGEMIQFDEHIFQKGLEKHELVNFGGVHLEDHPS